MSQQILTIPLSKLRLWTENPRDPVDRSATDEEIIRRAMRNDSGNWNLDKMLEDLGDQYYFSEIPTVVELGDEEYIVYDGNRRVALLKCMQNPELYSSVTSKLPWFVAPEGLLSQTSLPCNVCDLETALRIVEKYHARQGGWGRLQYEQFMHHHRGAPKGRLMLLDEATGGLVTKTPKLNEEYVQQRLLTDRNLNAIGFSVADGEIVTSIDDQAEALGILADIARVREEGYSSARSNPGDLPSALAEMEPEKYASLKPFEPGKARKLVVADSSAQESAGKAGLSSSQRKRSSRARREILFGGPLNPKSQKALLAYNSIKWMWGQYQKDPRGKKFLLLPLGCLMRVLLECVARQYYIDNYPAEEPKESAIGPFLRNVVKKKMRQDANRSLLAEVSTASKWLDGEEEFESILHGWVHGLFGVDETLLMRESMILGEIVRVYGE